MAALLLGMVGIWQAAVAAEPTGSELQQKFNQKYQQYLRADSQMLLPFPLLEMAAWKQIVDSRALDKLYSEPGVYYNNKVYTLTLYRAQDNGEYYLNAKGGFWGMDELSYGPLKEKDFE